GHRAGGLTVQKGRDCPLWTCELAAGFGDRTIEQFQLGLAAGEGELVAAELPGRLAGEELAQPAVLVHPRLLTAHVGAAHRGDDELVAVDREIAEQLVAPGLCGDLSLFWKREQYPGTRQKVVVFQRRGQKGAVHKG